MYNAIKKLTNECPLLLRFVLRTKKATVCVTASEVWTLQQALISQTEPSAYITFTGVTVNVYGVNWLQMSEYIQLRYSLQPIYFLTRTVYWITAVLKKYHAVPYKKVPWYFGAVLFIMVLPCTTVLVPWYHSKKYRTKIPSTAPKYHGTSYHPRVPWYCTTVYHGNTMIVPWYTMVLYGTSYMYHGT